MFMWENAWGASDAKKAEQQPLHAQPWAFGVSAERDDAIWRKGVDGSKIKRNSLPKKNKHAVDTSRGIDQALSKAIKNKNTLDLSVDRESTRWKVDPRDNSFHPDEDKVRDSKRVLRAYAGVQASEDLNISVGPELILKDDSVGEPNANANEPESAFGIGMKFKYDF